MSIKAALEKARSEKRTAFIPYLTAGDPDLSATRRFVKALAQCGADVIELGIPFSDPIADGPTNQLAATRALSSGTTLEGVLKLVSELREGGFTTPLVIFTYLNPVFHMGFETFGRKARAAGADGVLIVDLPPEEAEAAFLPALRGAGLETVFLASPTTAASRLPRIDAASSGFIYYVSRTGVTGAKAQLAPEVISELAAVKKAVRNFVGVGFGISTPDHARALAPHADAVIVGSALVKIIEKNGSTPAGVDAAEREIRSFVTSLVKELKPC